MTKLRKWQPKLSAHEKAHIEKLRKEIEPKIIARKGLSDEGTRSTDAK